MEVIQKKIRISLQTTIENDGDKEVMKATFNGSYLHKGNVEIITYIEHTEGLGEIHNRITIHPNKVNVKRSGMVRMNQQFILEKQTESLYRHPYGNIVMEITTKQITHSTLRDHRAGKVKIVYDVTMNGEMKNHHHLVYTYMEEKY